MKWQVAVDGRTIEIDSGQLEAVTAGGAGVYSVLLDGVSYEIRVIQTSRRTECGGVRTAVRSGSSAILATPAEARGRPSDQGAKTIAAPMPGKVVRVLVKRWRLGGCGARLGGRGSDENAK